MPIIVGYLSTAEGLVALNAASDEAERRGTSLVVVVSERADRSSAESDAERETVLAGVRERTESAGVVLDVREVKGSTDVADDLLTAAEETGAHLIVIGLRRRSPVGKLILGSNAQRILLDAPCPVLAVKPVRQ